jgi:hypothetical protein
MEGAVFVLVVMITKLPICPDKTPALVEIMPPSL